MSNSIAFTGNRKTHSPWSRESYELAYMAAFAVMGCCPMREVTRSMAEQTETVAELMACVKAMRDAPEYGRVDAGKALLRMFRASDVAHDVSVR